MDAFDVISFRHASQLRRGDSLPPVTSQTGAGMYLSSMSPHWAAESAAKHPNFGQLATLVSQAVLEIVCVVLLGYIVARRGGFNADQQKFLANMNTWIFTPCLIFFKIGSQLTTKKLADVVVIPFLFAIMTAVSLLTSWAVSKLFRFNRREYNFVTAMAVFGNSNSLPISLVMSLSATLPSLRWKEVKDDNAEEVAARGILYLVIFQQLGQVVRWSWGLNVLLRPADQYTVEEGGIPNAVEEEQRPLIVTRTPSSESFGSSDGSSTPNGNYLGGWTPAGATTPLNAAQYTSSSSTLHDMSSEDIQRVSKKRLAPDAIPPQDDEDNEPDSTLAARSTESTECQGLMKRSKVYVKSKLRAAKSKVAAAAKHTFERLPAGVQAGLSKWWAKIGKFLAAVNDFMNPPLYAMILSVIVACTPALQELFFAKHTWVNNSVTRAVQSAGDCAVPLILVCLGGNLARNTIPQTSRSDEDPKVEKKLLIASLVSRMVLPTILLTPVFALIAKYVPVSIVDDPIFVVVIFLLVGAPSALQLSQICQMNNVYIPVMAKLLVHSYVIWIFPSTLILVLIALEVVKWAVTGDVVPL